VAPGTTVHLLFGTGLGATNVLVPDVSGMHPDDARILLLDMRLRSIVIDDTRDDSLRIVTQSPAAGTSVREGYEVRLFLRDPDTEDVAQ